MNFDFLKNVTVSAAPVAAKAAPASRTKERQPQGEVSVIRLFKDGSVYPSQHLVDLMDLEYGPRDENGKAVGFGIDIVDSRDMESQFKSEVPFVGVAFVPRAEGRVDLFAMCKYDADGKPTATVATQGSNTYGKDELIPLLQAVYGDAFAFNEQGFVDLTIVDNVKLESPDSRFFIFKKISRGANAGKKDYAIRTNVAIYPLMPTTATQSTQTDADAVVDPAEGTEAGGALIEVEAARKATGKKVTKDDDFAGAIANADPFNGNIDDDE